MRTRYDVALDGQPLSAVDGRVLVLDVTELSPETESIRARWAGREGCLMQDVRRVCLAVRVTLEVHERDPMRRSQVISRVMAWTRGRMLTVSNRPGQRLRVRCTSLPETSALCWTQALTLVFTACETPWWEEQTPSRVLAKSSLDTTVKLYLASDAPAPLEATITNVSPSGAAFDSLTIRCGGQALCFVHLGMDAGERLCIGHDDADRLTLAVEGKTGRRSVMANRTPESSDEIWLQPGPNVLELTSGRTCDWNVWGRGRRL